MIYVDPLKHLFSDESVTELWNFAKKVGLKKEWNHYSKGFPHFDLMGSYIAKAKRMGAISLDLGEDFNTITDYMMGVVFNRQWHETIVGNSFYESKGMVNQKILRLK